MNEVVALFSVADTGEENGKARVTQDHAYHKVFPLILIVTYSERRPCKPRL